MRLFVYLYVCSFCFAMTVHAEDAAKRTKNEPRKDERVYLSSPDRPKAKPRVHRYKPQPKAEEFPAPNVLKKAKASPEAKKPTSDDAPSTVGKTSPESDGEKE